MQLQYDNFLNLAEIALTDIEKDILCRGLRCGISPVIKKDNIFAEFELAWQQLPKSTLSKSKEKERECMAGLSYVAHRFANTKVDCTGFRLSNRDITAIKPLKNNKDTIITKPDKGNIVVLLKRTEYMRIMQPILQDTSKFVHIGEADECDRTVQHEKALQVFLLREQKGGHLTHEVYDCIRPSGSTKPRMYGVQKYIRPMYLCTLFWQ